MTVIVITQKVSWWWVGVPLIIILITYMIIGIVLLVLKLNKKNPEDTRISAKDAETRVKNMIKFHPDNPDNFIIENQITKNLGDKTKDPTSIRWLEGHGSETLKSINALVNLNNKKVAPIIMFNKTPEYVERIMNTFAENPESVETQETVVGHDEYGRPSTKVITRRTSKAELKEKKEIEEAELQESF